MDKKTMSDMARYQSPLPPSTSGARQGSGSPVPSLAHMAALGHIVVAYAHLESAVIGLVGKLIACDENASDAITRDCSFQQLVNSLSALGRIRKVTPESLRSLCDALRAVNEARNRLLHSRWIASHQYPQGVLLTKMKVRGKNGLTTSFELYSVEDLRSIATWIEEWVVVVRASHESYLPFTAKEAFATGGA